MAHFIVFVVAFLFACGFVYLGGLVERISEGLVGDLFPPGEAWGIITVVTLFLFFYIRYVARLKEFNHRLWLKVTIYETALKKLDVDKERILKEKDLG